MTTLINLSSGTPIATDVVYVVVDPSGTPLDRKVTLAELFDSSGYTGTLTLFQTPTSIVIGGTSSVVKTLGSIGSKKTSAAGIALNHNSATGDYTLSLVPANLTAARTVSFPDTTGTVALLGTANVFTAAQTISHDVSSESLRFRYNSDATFYNYILNAWDGTTPNNNITAFFVLSASGTIAERMRITGAGNLKLGGTASRAGTIGTNTIDVFNGTPPTSTIANGISIYSAAGECWIMDAGGTATQQTPHRFELYDPDLSQIHPFSFTSQNPYLGKFINVDMYGAIAEIEKISGKKFIHTKDIPVLDWDADQQKLVVMNRKAIAAWEEDEGESKGEKPETYVAQPMPKWIADRIIK